MLIRKASDVKREADKWVATQSRRLSKTIMANSGFVNYVLSDRVLQSRPALAREVQEIVRIQEIADKASKSSIRWEKHVDKLYTALKTDNLCASDYQALFETLRDVDPRVALMYCKVCSKRLEDPITKDAWLDAISCAVAFSSRYDPVQSASRTPFGSDAWKEFYTLVVSYLLRAVTVEVKHVVKEKQKVKTVVLPIDQRLKDRVSELESALQSANDDSRKRTKSAVAAYNKAIRAQQMEIARLRSMLPEEEIQKLDAEPVANSELLPLPSIGVTFVGTLTTIGSKLKERYPDWDYIDTDVFPDTYPDNPLCFFNTRWISHKQYMHVRRWCPSNLLSCNLVNPDRLEREMQEAYTVYMRGMAKEEE